MDLQRFGGTCSENKILVFHPRQSNWSYSKLQCEPFSGGRLLMVALATSSVFTGKHGDSRSHVWVSFNRRAYIVCWDAVKKKQIHMVDCKKDMQIGKIVVTYYKSTFCHQIIFMFSKKRKFIAC